MAFVQAVGVDQEDFDDATQTLTITPTAGDLLAIGVAWDIGSGNITISVEDDKGNGWTPGVARTNSGAAPDYVQGLYAMNVAGGVTVVTITYSAAPSRQRALLVAFSGRATTAALEAGAAQSQNAPGTGANAVSSGNITTSVETDVFALTSDSNNQPTLTAGTNYTLRGTQNTGTAGETRDAVAAGTFAGTFTSSDAWSDHTTLVMAFKAPAGGGGATNPGWYSSRGGWW